MDATTRKKWNNYIYYWWKLLKGQAQVRPDFEKLKQDENFQELKCKLSLALQFYNPLEWEPLHSCYTSKSFPLPPQGELQQEAAELAASFVMILDKVGNNELPPSLLAPLATFEEIDKYKELTARYLEALDQKETWPLGFFYGVAAEMFKLREKVSSPVIVKKSALVPSLQPARV